MYESFYRFKAKPFALLPDSSFLYQGTEHQAAYSLLEYGILSEAPFMVLTGDPGVGKTSLLQKLIAEHGSRHKIGLVTNARYDIEQLLPWILLSLGLSTRRLDPIEAYHLFSEFLSQESKRARRVILIIDEAQSLGAELLEELRLLSNMNDGRTLKLQIILSGQPDLYTLLQRIDMTQFAQRIVVDYHLKPLSETDTTNCIRHRLRIAGGHPTLFSDQACVLVHRLSQGNPRLINQVADIALTYGYAEQARTITAKLVAQAALDRIKGRILPLAATEELVAIASAPEESLAHQGSARTRASDLVPDELSETTSTRSPEEDYERGMVLKEQAEMKEAVECFHAAARDKSLWFKAYAEVGFCYVKMREPQAAIQAFCTALDDPTAEPGEMMEVLYCLGRSLESVGKVNQAREVYDRINQSTSPFRDVPNRLKQLRSSPKPSGKGNEHITARHSWISGMIDNVQRLFIGTSK
ncbi:MAG: AAA family ATPase [Nitrospira sp.]|nr:AAA family ATPase [Nitrospira sp.]MDH4304848.1 AAA family ATPase [Nitrospira sp.]MDH5194935.1 AAA family ATPase [Nitrospira sp.]